MYLSRISEKYEYLFHELSDPRTKNWLFVSSPWPLLTIILFYLYFSIKAGPEFMKNRKPFQIKLFVTFHNILQISLCAYITYVGVCFIATEIIEDGCYMIGHSKSRVNMKWASGVWWYYFSKITELPDTIFIILRKKERQISFLHIYHHSVMPIIGFLGIKYAAGGQSVPQGALNALVHVIMYTYYLISGFGGKYQKYLWWKKYLTSMQLIQFCMIILLNISALSSNTCNYPTFFSIILIANCTEFFFLFASFYYQSYVKSSRRRKCE